MALLLLVLLLPAAPAFAHAAHHPQHGAAALQQVTATPAPALHAGHPVPPCCLGTTCVELVPMPAALSTGAPMLAAQPSPWPPARAPTATGLDPSPTPRPPKRAS